MNSVRSNLLKIASFSQSFARYSSPSKIGGTHRVNNLEKKFLVWTKKYKRVEDVPDLVPPDVVERARNRMRIKLANYMMAATLLGCLAMVYVGKQKRLRGETVEQQNILWHQKYNEEATKKNA